MKMQKNMQAYPEFSAQAGHSLFTIVEKLIGHSLR